MSTVARAEGKPTTTGVISGTQNYAHIVLRYKYEEEQHNFLEVERSEWLTQSPTNTNLFYFNYKDQNYSSEEDSPLVVVLNNEKLYTDDTIAAWIMLSKELAKELSNLELDDFYNDVDLAIEALTKENKTETN